MTQYFKLFFMLITLTLSSCTYDYVYEINDGKAVKKYTLTDNGFHAKVINILKEYGATWDDYHQTEQTVELYDKNGNQCGGHYDLSQDVYFTDPEASYLIVKVAMNAGKMGYICTEPFELKPGHTNEIVLDENTPVHVELNIPEESLPTRYIISKDASLDNFLQPIAQANCYDKYGSYIYVHEYNSKDEEIKETYISYHDMLGELQIATEGAAYFVVEIRISLSNSDGSCSASVDVDEIFNLTPHKLIKVNLDETTPLKHSRYSKFNLFEDDCSIKKYTITKESGFHSKVINTLKEYGATWDDYKLREQYIELYDKDGNRKGSRYYLAKDEYISDPGAAYLIVKTAMNAGEMGYVCTDPFELKMGVTNKIILDENTPVHVELNSSKNKTPNK